MMAMVLGEGARLAALGAVAGIVLAVDAKSLLERFAPVTPMAVSPIRSFVKTDDSKPMTKNQ